MMEIPSERYCNLCPMFGFAEEDCEGRCWNNDLPGNGEFAVHLQRELYKDDWKRSDECLSVYPNGAVITITAKEGK